MKARSACLILSACYILLFCGCDHSNTRSGNDGNSASFAATAISSVSDPAETYPDDPSGAHPDQNRPDSVLPKEAEHALFAYLKCDSADALLDSIYPSSVAKEMKNGSIQTGNYFFGGFPCDTYEDAEILECTRRSQNEVQNLAAFWAMGASLQGVSADFTAEEGYDVVVKATFTIDGEIESMTLRVTNKLTMLKIIDDRWIIVPSADTETYEIEVLE